MLQKLMILSALSPATLAVSQGDEHIANEKYEPKKPPVVNEPALSTEGQAIPSPLKAIDCTHEYIWSIRGPHKITVTATKDEKLPVSGNFDRIAGQLFVDKRNQRLLKAEGTIDLLSFNSGVPDRDRRVQRYILKAEKNPQGSFKAIFPQTIQLPLKASSEQLWKSTLTFADESFDLDLRMKAERLDATSIRLSSLEPSNLVYARESMKIGFQKLLELCNHKFLAKTVKLNLEMNLKAECPAR